MPLEFRLIITREMLKAEPDKLFVFGDNLVRRGLGGQAAEMRGEPNAIGLPTKRAPSMDSSAFLTDLDLPRVVTMVRSDWERLLDHVLKGKTVVWPKDGIGTGLAQLEQRAPMIADYYRRVLLSLK